MAIINYRYYSVNKHYALSYLYMALKKNHCRDKNLRRELYFCEIK